MILRILSGTQGSGGKGLGAEVIEKHEGRGWFWKVAAINGQKIKLLCTWNKENSQYF